MLEGKRAYSLTGEPRKAAPLQGRGRQAEARNESAGIATGPVPRSAPWRQDSGTARQRDVNPWISRPRFEIKRDALPVRRQSKQYNPVQAVALTREFEEHFLD